MTLCSEKMWIRGTHGSYCLKNLCEDQVFEHSALALVKYISVCMLYDTQVYRTCNHGPNAVVFIKLTSFSNFPNLKIKLSVNNDSHVRLNIHSSMYF